MLAVGLTLALFAGYTAVGLAFLSVLRTDTTSLRVVLSAPIVGSCIVLIPIAVLSILGVHLAEAGRPVMLALLAASVAILVVRRPRLPLATVPVLLLAILDLVLVGAPMFHFGFDWIADANGDMGLYVLAATELLHHGLLAPVDLHGLAHDRSFATFAQTIQVGGIRPGAQIGVAGLAATVGRPAVQVYMPMLLALNMSVVSATGALAMQAARRWWVATVAAALFVLSPLAAYGVVQQLMPQVWGLGIAVVLAAWLLRPELHVRPGPAPADLAVVALLSVALFLVYVEMASSVVVAYALYVLLLGVQRRLSLRSIAVLWTVPLVAIPLVVNRYFENEIHYLRAAATFGVSASHPVIRLFPYAIVPTALPGLTGLQELFSAPTAPYMGPSIVLAFLIVAGILFVAVAGARRGAAAAVVVLGDALIALLLGIQTNDFGLFKLYMYVQPFVAATVAVWLGARRRIVSLAVAAIVLVCIGAVQLTRLNAYVDHSRHPIDLPNASAHGVLPAFRELLESSHSPVVAVTDNFTLLELQGSVAGDNPIYFLSRNAFAAPWGKQKFIVPTAHGKVPIVFGVDRGTARVLRQGACQIVLPGPAQIALNRRILPAKGPDFPVVPCTGDQDLLAFVQSNRGQAATLPLDNRDVSMWQLEPDPAYAGNTLSGFGRFGLYQVLGPARKVRLVLDVTASPIRRRDGSGALPPADW
jgi:hypothetical protein